MIPGSRGHWRVVAPESNHPVPPAGSPWEMKMRFLPLLLPLLTGCIADVLIDVDGDGDGLLDSEEMEYGTDPGKVDSDDDGFQDGEEVDGNTNPADAADKPYQNGWTIDACRHDLESTGSEVGDVMENYEFGDQFGETVHVHDFCNQVVRITGAGFT